MARKRGLSETPGKPLRAGRRPAKSVGAAPPLPRDSKWAKIGPGGRVVIPASMRKALGVGEGDYVVLRLFDEDLSIVPRDVAVRRVQDLVAKYASGDKSSWVDKLIEERKREFEREERGE